MKGPKSMLSHPADLDHLKRGVEWKYGKVSDLPSVPIQNFMDVSYCRMLDQLWYSTNNLTRAGSRESITKAC